MNDAVEEAALRGGAGRGGQEVTTEGWLEKAREGVVVEAEVQKSRVAESQEVTEVPVEVVW